MYPASQRCIFSFVTKYTRIHENPSPKISAATCFLSLITCHLYLNITALTDSVCGHASKITEAHSSSNPSPALQLHYRHITYILHTYTHTLHTYYIRVREPLAGVYNFTLTCSENAATLLKRLLDTIIRSQSFYPSFALF